MPVLAPILSMQAASGKRYDADAEAYFTATGITDSAAKLQISDFIKGIKALGLWANTVCWPLRSAQNAGTGSTVYSFGGLGSYNGTIVNGATWDPSGLKMTRSSSQRISLPSQILATGAAYSTVGVAINVNTAQQYHVVTSMGNGRGAELYAQANGSNNVISYAWNSAGTGTGNLSDGTYSTQNFFAGINAADSNGYDSWWNGTQFAAGSGNYTLANVATNPCIGATYINSSNFANYFNGTIGFAAIFNVRINSTQRDAIYALLKSTICQGLGLP